MNKWLILVLPLFCWTGLKASQSGNEMSAITFAHAREIILEQNAGLEASKTETKAANEAVSQAGVLPNPQASINLENFGINEVEAGVEQTFELGGKRKLRIEVAQKDLEATANIVKMTQIELESEIIRRFIPITITESKLLVLDSLIATATSNKEQIERLIIAGASRKTDLLRVEIELEKYALDRSELIRQLNQAHRKFAALGGDKSDQLLSVRGHLDTQVPVPPLHDLQHAAMNSPLISSFIIEQARLKSQQKLLRAEATPDLNVSAGILASNFDDIIAPLAGVSLNVPLFNRNSAAQKQAELQQKAVLERKNNTVKLLFSEIEDLHSRLTLIDRQIINIKSRSIPKVEQAYSMLREYYDAGNAGFLDLTATRAELFNIHMDLLDLNAERFLTIADIIQKTTLQILIVK